MKDAHYRAAVYKQLKRDMAETEKSDQQIKAFLLNGARQLRDQYPEHFAKMRELVQRQRNAEQRRLKRRGSESPPHSVALDSDEFVLRVAEVIHKHQAQFSSPNWESSGRKTVSAIQTTLANLAELFDALQNLDPDLGNQVHAIVMTASKVAKMKVPSTLRQPFGYDRVLLLNKIKDAHSSLAHELGAYAFGISQLLAESIEEKGLSKAPNRPQSPYTSVALDLGNLWRSLTRSWPSDAKNPKRIAGVNEEAKQPSTEFVRRGLVMVDETLPPIKSNPAAVTAIKKVRKMEEEFVEFSRKRPLKGEELLVAFSKQRLQL